MINKIEIVVAADSLGDIPADEYLKRLRQWMTDRPDVDSDTKVNISLGVKTTYHGENERLASQYQSDEALAADLQRDAEYVFSKMLEERNGKTE